MKIAFFGQPGHHLFKLPFSQLISVKLNPSNLVQLSHLVSQFNFPNPVDQLSSCGTIIELS